MVWLLLGVGVAMLGLDRFMVEFLKEESSPTVLGVGIGMIISGLIVLFRRISKGEDY
ncbi:MAG: hypothetical protein Q7S01_02730 [bacterium]|nr:hypothetical protein [bacterium]